MTIVLGVDLGTTKITCVAMESSTRRLLSVATTANDANVTSEPDRSRGRSEWNVDRIVSQGITCLKLVAEQLADQVRRVSAIGVTGQQHGMLLVNDQQQPVTPLMNWQDRRALDPFPGQDHSWLDQARSLLGEEVWRRTGCRLQPGFMAGTLFWLKSQQQIPPDSKALFVMDHFASVLATVPAVTEPSCAGSSGVFNVRSRDWDQEAIAALGLPRSLFPEVCEADCPIGHLAADVALQTGLPRGIPVSPPIGDHQASFLGSVFDREESLLVNVGTGAQVAVYTSEFNFAPPIELRPFPGGGNLLSNVGLAGGWSYQVLEQFFRDVGEVVYQLDTPAPLYATLNQLAATVPEGAEGLRCEPLFAGTRLDPTVRGTLSGLSPQNFTARHLARAVLEGMGRSLQNGYAEIERITGRKQTRLIAAGNGLRENPVLSAIVAKAFGLPMEFTEFREEAACGAALIAARIQQNSHSPHPA